MRKLSFITALFAMFFIAACGDGSGFVSTGGPGTGGNVDVSVVNVLASSPSLPSDPGQLVDITVVVRDQNNVAVSCASDGGNRSSNLLGSANLIKRLAISVASLLLFT